MNDEAPKPAAEPEPGTHVRVLLIDVQPLVRQGLAALIERTARLTVVAAVGSVDDAAALDVHVDVVVTEIEVGAARGEVLVRRLSDAFPAAAVLVLSISADPAHVRQALAAGAAGYLLKSSDASDLVAAIVAVGRGETYLQPSLGVALSRAQGRPAGAAAAHLTEAEVEVLHLIALGHTNAEIARRLDVSVRTVESHRARIGHKVGGTTRADLVREAHRFGVAQPGADDY